MRTLVALGLGALAMYLLDPQHGPGRRSRFRDRLRQYVNSTEAPESAQHLGR
jgi:hypothetical protein